MDDNELLPYTLSLCSVLIGPLAAQDAFYRGGSSRRAPIRMYFSIMVRHTGE